MKIDFAKVETAQELAASVFTQLETPFADGDFISAAAQKAMQKRDIARIAIALTSGFASIGGKAGTGLAKRRDVDYAALGRKGGLARQAK